jgi:hypothetical protein
MRRTSLRVHSPGGILEGVREIPPFRLLTEPMNDEAASLPPFNWADPEIGTRHRLGGRPEAIQAVEYPECPHCGEKMTFYGQLDSLNDEFCIADVGLVYVFVCFECSEATALVDSY